MKKSIYLSIVFLSGCSSLIPNQPAYKISDQEIKQYILESNKLEQCLYPTIVKANNDPIKLRKIYDAWTNEERYLIHMVFQNKILPSVIGSENARKISSDPLSQQYLNSQHDKFNHSNPVVMNEADKKACKTIKNDFNSALKQVRAEIKKRELAQKAEERKREKERKAQEAYLKTPAGQMELARMQQDRQHQEMMALQRQQLAQQQAMQKQMAWQQLNQQIQQAGQRIQQINQSNMQMMQQMMPQRVIVTPSYQAPCFGTGPCWNNVY